MNTIAPGNRRQRIDTMRLIRLTILLALLALALVGPVQAGPAETALNWVLGQLDEALPGSLSYDSLRASFTGPVTLEGVRYEDGELLVTVSSFELAVDISVFSRAVTVNRLQAFDVDVRLPPPGDAPPPSDEPFSLSDVSLPVSLDIRQVAIRDLSILPHGADQPFQIDRVNLAARTEDTTIRIDNAEVVTPGGQAALNGSLTPVGEYPLDLNLNWDWTLEQAGSYNGRGRVTGDLGNLRITQVVLGALRGELRASLREPLTNPAWEASLNAVVPDLGVYQADYRDRDLQVRLQTRGSLSDYRASGTLASGALPEVGELAAAFEVAGTDESLRIDALRLSASESPLQLDVNADIDLARQVLSASGNWQDLAWPLTGDPQVAIPEGTFRLDGTLDDFRFGLQTRVQGEQFGNLRISADGEGDRQQIRLASLDVAAVDGPLAVTLLGNVALQGYRFEVQGRWQAIALPLVGKPQLSIPSGTLSASGTPDDYRAALDTRLEGPRFGTLDAELRATGDTTAVRITNLGLREPAGDLVLGGTASLGFADTRFQADLDWEALRWPLLGDPQVISPDGSLGASGTPSDYQATLNAALIGPEAQPLSAEVALSGSDRRIDISTLRLTSPGDGPALTASAGVSLQPLELEASGNWENLVWPLSGEPQVQVPSGALQVAGDADAYTFRLQTRVAGPAIPATEVDLSGQGSAEALQQATLRAGVLGGEINADLSARWQPDLGWRAELSGEGLDIGGFYPEFPGTVGFAASSQGRTEDTILVATVNIDSLDGSLRGQALAGAGTVTLRGETVLIDNLEIGAGQARVRLDGRVAEELALDWGLDARLAPLLPDFRGRIQGQGNLAGTRETPRVVADLTVAALAGAGVAVEALDLDATVDLGAGASSSVDLQGRGIVAGGQTIETLSLQGRGSREQHRLDLAARTDAFGSLELGLAGGLGENNLWRGNLAALQLADTPAGTWQLAAAAPLQAGPEAASLATACLVQQPAQVCLEGNWRAAGGADARVVLSDLTAALAGDRLPENLTVETRLGGEIQVRTDPGGGFEATADLTLAPGRVVTEVNGNPVEIPLAGGGLALDADTDRASGELSVDLGALGGLSANATLTDLATRAQVDGSLQANILDLSLAETLVPQLVDVDGRIEADLRVQGTPPVLDLGGSLALRDASTDIPEVNVALSQLNLEARGVGAENLALEGSVRSGEGALRFGGELAPLERRVALTIQGERFQVINTADIQALASPDLAVTVSPEQIRVTGEVRIPQAFISPPELQASGIRPDGDVVIVRGADGQTITREAAAGAPVFARVRVILGDEVYLSAAGFEGKLEGNLEVTQRPGLAPQGSGSIQVASGQYRIAGQEIEIQRGRILFGGGPITQPGLDLRVARQEDGVTAGVNVTGPVAEPKLTFFSSPAMPDSSVLSYLIFGRPPDTRASGENAMLLSAVTGGSSLLTQQVGAQVGLDDLRIVGDGTDEASLLVGKYLTPELWVGYGVGLLNAVNEFLVRYSLTDNIDLEASTSEEGTGADITYTIER